MRSSHLSRIYHIAKLTGTVQWVWITATKDSFSARIVSADQLKYVSIVAVQVAAITISFVAVFQNFKLKQVQKVKRK
jgi:hypothetical protein